MKTKLILIVSLLIGGGLSIFASSYPDGLERVAEEHNFIGSAGSFWSGLIPDYVMPGIGHEELATALAGISGTLIVFGILYLIGLIINHLKYEPK